MCVNSVWFWGPGYAPTTATRTFSHVYTDDVLMSGAAQATHAACTPVPSGCEGVNCEGDVLIVLRGAQGPVQYGDTLAWSAFLEALVAAWLTPLKERLARDQIQELVIGGDRGPMFRLTRRDLWRFWRAWR